MGLDLIAFAPVSLDSVGVRATTYYDNGPPYIYPPHQAFDTTRPLTGSWSGNAWIASDGTTTNQRIHVDLGGPRLVAGFYYENLHHMGGYTDASVKDFTLWGSNLSSDFTDLVYANDGTWTQIATAISTLPRHFPADIAHPSYVPVTALLAPYRYFAFKFANHWGGAYMGIRRIVLMGHAGLSVGPSPPPLAMRGRHRMR